MKHWVKFFFLRLVFVDYRAGLRSARGSVPLALLAQLCVVYILCENDTVKRNKDAEIRQ